MTTKRTARERGKKYEKRIAEKIHQALLSNNKEYKHLFETLENPELKPQRDSSSGTFTRSTGDIDLGLAKKYFPKTCEVKDWKVLDLSLNTLFKKQIKSLTTIWKNQIVPAMNKTGLEGLLVFKAQRTLDFCFLPKIELDNHQFNPMIIIDEWAIILFDDYLRFYINKGK